MGQYPSTESHTFTPSDAFFLTEATRTGSLDVVRLFLRKNPALVYASQAVDHNTPWHVAAAAGHELVLRVLLDTTRANAVSNTFDPLTKVINKQVRALGVAQARHAQRPCQAVWGDGAGSESSGKTVQYSRVPDRCRLGAMRKERREQQVLPHCTCSQQVPARVGCLP